jgi:ABC-type nitrate/sulfonate/bicarbonate transport system permease component
MTALIDHPDQPVASVAAEARAKLGRATRSVVAFSAFVAAAGLAWHLAVTGLAVPSYIMPSPAEAFQSFVDSRGEIGLAVGATLRNAALGLAAALVVAMALAALFSSSPTASRAVLPLVIALRTAPVLAIAPILIMIFGRGIGTAIVVVVIVSFFPIMVNAMKGFGAVRRNLLELMHVVGASWRQTFFKVRFPYALSFIFTGLRSAATSALLAAMLAEWLSGANGLGTLILDAASYKKNGLLWAAVVVSMIVAFVIFSLTAVLERRLTLWRS